jgi:adenylosuccinate lyase
MSHSSVERVALPDACVLLAHGLQKATSMLTMLEWQPDKTEYPGIRSFDELHIAIRDGADRQEAHHRLKTEQGLR